MITRFLNQFLILLLFSSCEKSITINIEDNTSKIVIEGSVTDGNGPYFVKISNSTNINDSNSYKSFDNANVYLLDNLGFRDTLSNMKFGVYKSNKLKGLQGNSYTLEVYFNDKFYFATNKIPIKVNLDSVILDSISYNGNIINTIIPVFQDPISKGNYYRFIQRINDTLDKTFYLSNDLKSNASINKIPLISINSNVKIKKNDIISLEMQCISKFEYDYFSTLSQQINFGINGNFTPSNPQSNIIGGALGFFSAHTVQQIIFKYTK
jgi:hypothetical protein